VGDSIPVTVVGGYLGAGKTSLINHVLRSATERIAVLVNDFGSVNIDAALVEASDGDTITLANGCICCSLSDGYVSALQTIAQVDPPPDRLIIEASGVSDPATVAAYAYTSDLTLDGVVLLIDLEQIERQLRNPYIGDVIARQLSQADIVIANKADLIRDGERDRALTQISEQTAAPCIQAIHGAVALGVLVGFDPERPNVGTLPPAEQYHETWEHVFSEIPTRAQLNAWLASLGPNVLRVKGFVRLADSPDEVVLVQRVGVRTTITSDQKAIALTSTGRLVGISRRIVDG